MRNIRNSDRSIAGYSLTNQRRLLLELIDNAGGHIDAKELYRRASSTDTSISLATVYRNLRLFQRLGLVDERRLGQSSHCYEIHQPSRHQHFVCCDCGKVIEFQAPAINKLVVDIQRKQGFSVTRAEFYLEGYCRDCHQNRERGG
ncbi:MAG TPA: transcriptional repressor [Dehalococcoidia bacterium]|nr:transcriptional repressor [Dehalococcoidia bacterium]